jgi:hypothetical protein
MPQDLNLICNEDIRIDKGMLEDYSFFHFQELVAFPKMNDLIFRSRLFSTAWLSRKEILQKIQKFFFEGNRLGQSLNKKELSLERDYHILFDPKEQLDLLLAEEADFLPRNQTHRGHEDYALLAELARLQTREALPEEGEQLFKATNLALSRKTPKISSIWLSCQLMSEKGLYIGPQFYAPNVKSAEAFAGIVDAALAQETPLTDKKVVGLYALGFLPPDPTLMTKKAIDEEFLLVEKIITTKRAQMAPSEELNEPSWNPENTTTEEL